MSETWDVATYRTMWRWDDPRRPVKIGNRMYVDFPHAAVNHPEDQVRDMFGRIIGIVLPEDDDE